MTNFKIYPGLFLRFKEDVGTITSGETLQVLTGPNPVTFVDRPEKLSIVEVLRSCEPVGEDS